MCLRNCSGSATINAMSEIEPQAVAEPLDPSPFAEQPDQSPSVEQLHVPQFGIIHLMLWTAVTAVLLKVLMALMGDLDSQLPAEFYWISRISATGYAILWASGLVGTGVLLRLRSYRILGRLQPGHWLVLITTLEFALQVARSLVFWLLQRVAGVGAGSASIVQISAAVMNFLIAAVSVLAFVKLRDTRRWKMFFGVKAFATVATAVAMVVLLVTMLFPAALSPGTSFFVWIRWISVCMTIWSVAVFLMFVVVVGLDLWRRATRDWLHWLGVGIVGGSYVLILAMVVVSLFLK